jgi:hypothetical protein
MARHHQDRALVAEPRPGQSAMAQASSARPFTAYTYRGWDRPEPPEVTAAREGWRTHEAALEAERNRHRRRGAVAVGPGTGRDPLAAREMAGDEPAPPPVPPPAPDRPAERCESCGYLTTAPGHTIVCGDGRAR